MIEKSKAKELFNFISSIGNLIVESKLVNVITDIDESGDSRLYTSYQIGENSGLVLSLQDIENAEVPMDDCFHVNQDGVTFRIMLLREKLPI